MCNGTRRLVVELAGLPIGIEVVAETRSALTYCESYFEGFTVEKGDPVACVTILRPSAAPPATTPQHLLEHRLTPQGLRQCVGPAIEVEASTICAGCMDGCLAYHPATRSARLFLGGAEDVMFAPLHRLMWMFFAQSLGDLGCFFVHAAAVADSDCGYLFFGDSGEGKTTLARNVQEGSVLADDGPLISHTPGGGYWLYPSPYHQTPVHVRPWGRVPGGASPATAFYLLDQSGASHNRPVPASRAVPAILQRFIHFWGYLSPGGRRAAFDLFTQACHTLPVHYLTVPEGADALALVSSPDAGGNLHG